jgi:hypothetical protein
VNHFFPGLKARLKGVTDPRAPERIRIRLSTT